MANNSGWQTDVTFAEYLKDHLLSQSIQRRDEQKREEQTILLLLDSHITRAQPDLLQFCRNHNVAILTFPSHTSHLVQPLDCGINAAIKTKISEYIDQLAYLFVHIIPLISFKILCREEHPEDVPYSVTLQVPTSKAAHLGTNWRMHYQKHYQIV